MSSAANGTICILGRVSLRAKVAGEANLISVGAIVSWIVVGLVAGILAKWAMPGPDPGGILVTVLVGIAGAFLGGYLVQTLLGGPGVSGVNLPSIFVATLGALILLAIYRLITRRAV